MGTLYLVRHGQASAFEENYDRLSTAGEQQARLFGEWWGAGNVTADRVFTGPRERQKRTAEIAVEASRGKLPPPVVLEDLDEMRLEPLFKANMPELFEKHEHLRGLGDALLAADGDETRARHMSILFEAMLQLWGKGELEAADVEPWVDFRARVRRALESVRDGIPDPGLALRNRGRKIVAFTSAGVIGAAVQNAIRCDDECSISLAFRVRNSSLSEFLFSGNRFSLLSFNGLAHLADPELVTLR
jgi:broad specificity phosphatase PhoE